MLSGHPQGRVLSLLSKREDIKYISLGLENNSEWKIQEIQLTLKLFDSDAN